MRTADDADARAEYFAVDFMCSPRPPIYHDLRIYLNRYRKPILMVRPIHSLSYAVPAGMAG